MKNLNPYFLIFILSIVLFVPFLGEVHLFDWDEINFAESAREMIVSGDYTRVMVNFTPFWEKPPLFMWLQVLSMKIFGINEFAARFPNAICGFLTLSFLFYLGNKHFNKKIAWYWVLAYLGSFTPHFYFKSGIIDPFFNLFIFAGIYQLYLASIKMETSRLRNFLFAGLFLGLAVLTKGPVALLVSGLSGLVYLIINRKKGLWFNFKDLLVLALAILSISFFWFGLETIKNGPFFLEKFILYQIDLFKNPVASHGQPFYYHPLVLLAGCFPISILALQWFFKPQRGEGESAIFILWMQILFWVVLILFSIVKTKIVHYSSLCYPPLTFFAALMMDRLINRGEGLKPWAKKIILGIGLLFAIIFILIPLSGANDGIKNLIMGSIKDPFAVANFSRNVSWAKWEWLIGVFTLAGIIMAWINLQKDRIKNGLFTALAVCGISLQLIMIFVLPKIEKYSQGAAIEFWESLKEKNVYVQPLGYDSYGHYFYYGVKPEDVKSPFLKEHEIIHGNEIAKVHKGPSYIRALYRDWLYRGKIEKDAYFCVHMREADFFRKSPEFIEIGKDGGFVFLMRKKTY